MDISNITRSIGPLLKRNSSTILTGLGIAGSVGALILAVKVTPRAQDKLTVAFQEKNYNRLNEDSDGKMDGSDIEPLNSIEVVKLVWRDYLPAVGLEIVTIGCVIGAQSINLRRQAAWISAFSISEAALREYQDRMAIEAPTKDRKVRDDIARDKIAANPVSESQVIIMGKGEQLFFEPITGRYWMSDMETVRKAVNDINFRVLNQNYASQNEFYTAIGLPAVEMGDELGWTPEHEMSVDYSAQVTDDGRAAVVIDYWRMPLKNYWKGFQ